MSGDQETSADHDGTNITFKALPRDPNAVKLCKTISSDKGKLVRVLRSYRLVSEFAPIGGLRYDGL